MSSTKTYASYGRNVSLITDHKSLTTIVNPKTELPALAEAQLQQWAIPLSAYQCDIVFQRIRTHQHTNAYCLSHLSLHGHSL